MYHIFMTIILLNIQSFYKLLTISYNESSNIFTAIDEMLTYTHNVNLKIVGDKYQKNTKQCTNNGHS